MMDELERLKDAIHPDEILLVADGMTGQDAVKIAQGFDERARRHRRHPDEDGRRRARRRGAVDLRRHEEADQVHRRRREDGRARGVPSRAHGGPDPPEGDIVSLVEKAQDAFDADEAKKLEKKVRKEGMDLQDFLTAMKQMQKLGPLEGLLKMLPGVNAKMLKQVNADPEADEARRGDRALDDAARSGRSPGSSTARAARASRRARGRPISEVNRLLEQFREMQKMMKKAAGGGGRVAEVPAAGDVWGTAIVSSGSG